MHRIVNDSGRIGEGWFRRLGAAGLSDERYVELVSVVAVTTCVDSGHSTCTNRTGSASAAPTLQVFR